MIPLTLKIDKTKQDIDIPVSWDELSYVQAIALAEVENPENHISIVEILSGVSRDILNSMEARVFEKLLYPSLEIFTQEQPDFTQLEIPKTIHVRGKDISTDLNPARMFAASMWAIQEGFKEDTNEEIAKKLNLVIAHAVAKELFETFDEEQIQILAMEISHFPAFIVYPVGSFFLQKLSKALNLQLNSLEKVLLKKRSLRESKNLKNSGPFLRLIRYVKGIGRKRSFTKTASTE